MVPIRSSTHAMPTPLPSIVPTDNPMNKTANEFIGWIFFGLVILVMLGAVIRYFGRRLYWRRRDLYFDTEVNRMESGELRLERAVLISSN